MLANGETPPDPEEDTASARLAEAERARLAAESHLRMLLETAPDAMITASADGIILLANRRAEEIFGYEKSGLVGAPFTRLFPERFRATHEAGFRRHVETAGQNLVGRAVEVPGRRLDGSEFPLELSVAAWQVGGDRFFSASVRDVTARKRAEAALEWQYQEAVGARREARAILDATSEAMVLLSPEGRIINVNRQFGEFFVLKADAILGLPLRDVRAELGRVFGDAAVCERLTAALVHAGGASTMELRQQWPAQREFQVYSTPVQSGESDVLGRLFVFRDVTAERAADRLKNEFVPLVSHELRTPLTSIKGYIDLLAAGEVGPMTGDQLEFLGIAKSNADRLVALINDLLDISRIEAGKVELRRQPLALGPLLQQVVTSFRPQLEARQQRLRLELPADLAAIDGDADRLTQVFTNLLSNATKYTPLGGSTLITASAQPDAVQVDVTDTGIGMTPEELEQLFTKFFRSGHRLVREAGGTGLGLTITRSLVELHGGQILVRSTFGHGSTFSVRLPRTAEPLTPPLPERKPERPVAGSRVLVVDDEPDIAQLIRRYLEHGGYEVQVALSGSEAWRLVRQQPPDLITLDINLPDVDGFTVLEWLKNDPATASIPVVFLSIDSEGDQSIRLGAIDYLTKPVREDQLLTRVARALADHHSHVIIVADDDDAARSLIASHLRRGGYQVREATDGQDVLRLAQEGRPDLILLDINLAGVDAIAALRALRATDSTHSLPVVIMTASPALLENQRATIEALGGLVLATKPCTPEELAAILSHRLERERHA